jgi:hypothetical protein
MQQQVTARFYLEEKEIREALYDYFVRKFKANNINSVFTPEDINLNNEEHDIYITLEIKQNKEII